MKGTFTHYLHCITEYYAHFPYEITIENILKSFYFDKHRSYNAISIKPKIALYLLNLETEVQGRGMILGVARPLFLEWIWVFFTTDSTVFKAICAQIESKTEHSDMKWATFIQHYFSRNAEEFVYFSYRTRILCRQHQKLTKNKER